VTSTTAYEIRVSGLLDQRWWAWFEGSAISHETPDKTVLRGRVSDQRSLIGILVTLYELGHPVVSMAIRQ